MSVAIVALVLAAVAYLIRWDRRREGVLLAAGCLAVAAAELHRLPMPLMPAAWLSLAAPLATAAFVLFGAAAALSDAGARARARVALVGAERRRIANDLHDGLAQDLAFIASYAERLAREHGSEHPVAIAARRALQVSQGVMVDLAASEAPTAEAALRSISEELAPRFGVEVCVQRETEVPEPEPAERLQLVRIAREAIANAARHGGARRINVTLGPHDPKTVLRISDDGRGMAAPSAAAGTGLGMMAMRDRAAGIGSELIAAGNDLGGTDVSVVAAVARGSRAITD
jgi:signal transduction histidine kinase